MQQLATRPWIITAAAALAGASVIAVTPLTTAPVAVHISDVQLTSTDYDITLDFVRHGQSEDNVASIIGTVAPGAPLTAEGEQQAQTVAQALQTEFPDGVNGVFASGLIRTQETAAPFATLENMPVQDLSGLNELNAGIFEGAHQNTLTELGYIAAPLLWTLGLYFVPELGSSDYSGAAFESRFSAAVDQIYNQSATSPNADVAFSHAAAIMTWVMMNVKNPDPLLIIQNQLSNTGQVVIEGNPTDGWTLESWNGMDIAPASLLTELFVDVRNLITAPQMALFNLWQALIGADPTAITTAAQAAFQDVGTALAQFPESVFNDISAVLQEGAAGLAGLVSGEPGPVIADALSSVI
ncbi:MAG TPA: histidine phosphatase family protein [Mycobacterium sp.]|nr:histidine phosphatase family protein [Mycobacterium sp.]